MHLNREWIERHIPHKGRMCLLDEVLQWDPTSIRCGTSTHRSLDNPLRAHGRLGAACGIEYATQAMAVHGALLTPTEGTQASSGFLGSLRAITLHVARLDQIEGTLIATVARVSGDPRGALYEFSVHGPDQLLLSGRATVVLLIPEPRAVSQRPSQ